jgi:hypothetical protein
LVYGGSQFIEGLATPTITLFFERDEIFEGYAPVRTDFVVRDLAPIQEIDEMLPRHA